MSRPQFILSPLTLLILVSCLEKDRGGYDSSTQSVDTSTEPVDTGTEPVDTSTDLEDADGDGFDAGEDCDDDNNTVSPAADEVCDSVDNNCDGVVDENTAIDAATWYADADADGYGDAANTTAACSQPSGHVANDTDCNDGNANASPAADEVCDLVDNNCDGDVDENTALDAATWYVDVDGDGYGDASSTTSSCYQPTGYVSPSYAADCNDGDASISPVAVEICDGIDNDCNGLVDDGLTDSFYADVDDDGYGDTSSMIEDCETPSGYTLDSTDCDDTNGAIHPAASEVCDGVDNDCDADVDDHDSSITGTSTWYLDYDYDGYGGTRLSLDACEQPSNYVANNTDCNDDVSAINPAATEVCDGIDNDCDTETDEPDAQDASTWYADTDTDSFGDSLVTTTGCDAPTGYVADDSDCNDANAAINPAAPEVCDGIDNNCDTSIDDGVSCGYSGVISTSEAAATINGRTEDNSRSAIQFWGDLDYNGDGINDLWVADYGWDTAYTDAGGAFLLLGPVSGDIDINTDAALIYTEEQYAASVGNNGVHGGDIDGDNLDELLVSGSSGVMLIDDGYTGSGVQTLLDGSAGVTLLSTQSSARFIGDINGDGMEDVLLQNGALLWGDPVASTSTTSVAYNGSTVGLQSYGPADFNGDGLPDWVAVDGDHVNIFEETTVVHTITNAATLNGGSGQSEGRVTALDGNYDGYDDLVSADYSAWPSDPFTGPVDAGGVVWMFEGSATGITATHHDMYHFYLEGGDNDRVGSQLSSCDFDGDNRDDLFIGVEGGTPLVFYGPISAGSYGFGDQDASFDSYLHDGLSPAGDVNLDGIDDMYIGSYRYTKQIFLYHGAGL